MSMRNHMLRAAAGYSVPAPPSTDPQFNYVTMLLHGDGTNGAQNNTFVDSSTNNFTITRNGTPTQGSFSPYGDLWSNQFSGSSQYLSFTPGSAFAASGDFTIEAWIYLNGSQTDKIIFQIRTTGGFSFFVWPSGQLTFGNVNVANQVTSSNAIPVNQWVHVAAVRSGTGANNIKLYINGVNDGTTSSNYSYLSGVTGFIGGINTGNHLNGYISNLRVVIGTALYTSAFTPSTTPLTAVSGTSLLTCQSNRFRDNSSNNFAITVTGTPSVQRFSPFDPAAEYSTSVIGGSGQLPGVNTSFLSIPQNTAFDFGAGDFTVEAWVYPTVTTQQAVVGKWTGVGQVAWIAQINPGSSNIQFAYGNAGVFSANVTFSGTIRSNSWSHIAFTRSGTSVRAFINGVQAGTTQTIAAVMTATNANLVVGKVESDNNNAFNGYLTDVRVVKGTAVYTAAFTPPTAPLTAITNTSLLLNTINAGIFDNAMMNDLVTVGNAQVSTAVVKYGTGSIAFDGSGDYLTSIDTPNLQFGTGDFTIESWVYMTTVSYECGIVSKGASSTGWSFGVNASATNRLFFLYGTSNLLFTNGIPQNTWTHVALTRSGSTVRAFINGVQDATTGTISTSIDDTSILRVGEVKFGTRPLNGYIDDLRITKGVARYTANFTPPTAAFPNN